MTRSRKAFVVDGSTLKQFAACDRKGVLEARGYRAEESRYLLAGSAVHEGLAEYLRGNGVGAALDAIALAGGRLAEHDFVPQDDRLALHNVMRVARGWFDTHAIGDLPWTTQAVEVAAAAWLTDDIIYVGRMDGLGVDRLRQPWIIEHKTSGKIDRTWLESWRMDSSITGYTWLMQQAGNHRVGVIVNGVNIVSAPNDAKRKCPKHGVAYSECGMLSPHVNHQVQMYQRTVDAVAEWRNDAVVIASKLRELVDVQPTQLLMRGSFHGNCGFCGFRKVCEPGLTEALLQTLATDEWQPVDGITVGKVHDADDVFDAVRRVNGITVHQ